MREIDAIGAAVRDAKLVFRQRGFTLVEVLVSALVLSIGLIGVAGLQAVSLKNNQSAYMRSIATTLAYDIADRMRANVPTANGGGYDPALAALTAGCRSVTGCSPASMANNDLAEWNALVTSRLPAGQGYVCIDSTPNDGTGSGDAQCDGNGTQYALKIWWDDNRDGATTVSTTDNERLVVTFRL